MKYIKNNYSYLLFSFYLLSIIFWILEMGYSLVFRDKLVNPGTWYGPYCPIYGLAFVVLSIIFRKEDNVFLNIGKIAFTVTSMEYLISFISEKTFHRNIWNYSNKLLNLNGRICLQMSAIFTVSGIVMMYLLAPLIRKLHDKLGNSVKYINIILSIIMIIDIILTLVNKAHLY